jgi:hypothetical protein
MQLKLGLKPPTQASIDAKSQQLREFSSDQKITVIETSRDEGIPGVAFATFEFDIAGDEVYHAVVDQCVAWVYEADSGVVVYSAIRNKPFDSQ